MNGSAPAGLVQPKLATGGTNLFVIGDWGARSGIQRRVAQSMEMTAVAMGTPLAILSTGDNIYNSGVKSADDPLWKSTFEDVYTQKHIQVPWVAVLGNHDHRGSIQGQIDYSKRNKRWVMPDRYFDHLVQDGETTIAVVCLDTQQLLQRSTGWQDQLKWLKKALAKHEKASYIIVNGHHPMRSYGHYGDQQWMLTGVKPLMERYGASIYVCGHDHDLQIVQHPEDDFTCIVSGGGGGCNSTKWGEHSKAVATGGGFVRIQFDVKGAQAQVIDDKGKMMGRAAIPARGVR